MIHYGKLKHLSLGSVRPLHFLREQMERNRRGMGENLRKLAPEFIGEPYTRGVPDSASKPCYPGWQAEISGVDNITVSCKSVWPFPVGKKFQTVCSMRKVRTDRTCRTAK